MGLIDEVVDGDLAAAGVAFAEKIVREKRPLKKIRDLDDKVAAVRGKPEVFAEFRKSVARQTRGFRRPRELHQGGRGGGQPAVRPGDERERELFQELIDLARVQGPALLLLRGARGGQDPRRAGRHPGRDIKKAAVIGAGTMGGGIAMNFANAGIPVTVVEVAQEALDRGLGVVRKNYEATAARGRLTPRTSRSGWASSPAPPTGRRSRDADIVIEAVFEEMPIKKEVFAKIDGICKPGAVLATNTSTLDVDEIASATKRPDDVIGMHFFSPANVMRLLEIVRGEKSAKDVIATAMARRPADRQGAGAGRRLLRLRRQPHAPPARPRGREADPGGRAAARGGQGAHRLRLPDGPVRDGRPGRPRRGLAHPQGQGREVGGAPTASASWAASARRPARATSATRRATAPRSPTRTWRRSSSRSRARWASPAGRSATTRSWPACSTRW